LAGQLLLWVLNRFFNVKGLDIRAPQSIGERLRGESHWQLPCQILSRPAALAALFNVAHRAIFSVTAFRGWSIPRICFNRFLAEVVVGLGLACIALNWMNRIAHAVDPRDSTITVWTPRLGFLRWRSSSFLDLLNGLADHNCVCGLRVIRFAAWKRISKR
jgi:hypothetical protein